MSSTMNPFSFEDLCNKKQLLLFQEEITCNICSNIFCEPVQCSECNNCFCLICIQNWNKESNSCIYRCTNSRIVPANRFIKNILSKLIFKCNNCLLEIQYDSYLAHYKSECKFNRIQTDNQEFKQDNGTQFKLIKEYTEKIQNLEKEKEKQYEIITNLKKDNELYKDLNIKQLTEIQNLKSQYDIIKTNFYKVREEKKLLEEELKNYEDPSEKKKKKKKK